MIEPGWGFAVNTFCGDPETGEVTEMMGLGRDAEQAGFDSVWVGDHVLWHTPIVDALSMLAAFTATTERILVGTAIYLLGLRQPIIAAKAITSLNVMSGGRLVLGVGVGGENPDEFSASGVRYEDRGRLLDDALTVLTAQWDPDAPTPSVSPKGDPIPVLVGGRSDATRRRIGRFGAGWIAAFVSPRRIREDIEILNAARGAEVPVALNIYLRTEPEHERAEREAAAFLSEVYAMEAGPLMRYSVAGAPQACAEALARYAEAGVRHFILRPAAWDQREQMGQWSEHLLPLLRRVSLPAPVSRAGEPGRAG
jgi:alkanesulfonate monooxygenase SsuD/methylene tetrahydromethanopterin reductase-like flavin-dependent oxidoreductase (luciferase family)